jgi:hypothetical protein
MLRASVENTNLNRTQPFMFISYRNCDNRLLISSIYFNFLPNTLRSAARTLLKRLGMPLTASLANAVRSSSATVKHCELNLAKSASPGSGAVVDYLPMF